MCSSLGVLHCSLFLILGPFHTKDESSGNKPYYNKVEQDFIRLTLCTVLSVKSHTRDVKKPANTQRYAYLRDICDGVALFHFRR